MCLYYIYIWCFLFDEGFFGVFPLAMWIDPCHGIARTYLVRENYIQFVVKAWATYFPFKRWSMRFFVIFPLAMWIDPCHGIARPYLVWENYIQFIVNTWVTYFPLKRGSMHVSVGSALTSMDKGLIIAWTMHMSNNGNMSILIQRGHIRFQRGKSCTPTR